MIYQLMIMRLGRCLPIFLGMVEEITRGINKVQDLASRCVTL